MAQATNAEHGNIQNFKRVAGEAFFKPAGESGFINLGDVVMHKFNPQVNKKDVKKHNRYAFTSIAREDVIESSGIWEVDLQEHVVENVEILLFGTRLDDYAQAQAAATVVDINGVVQRRVYELGALNISNVSVKVGVVAKAAGTDYVIDAAAGTVYIVDGGGIADGTNIIVTFDQAAITMDRIAPMTQIQREGSFKIIESDNQSTDLRAIYNFPCSLAPSAWGEENVEGDPNKFTLRAVATGPIDVKYRQNV